MASSRWTTPTVLSSRAVVALRRNIDALPYSAQWGEGMRRALELSPRRRDSPPPLAHAHVRARARTPARARARMRMRTGAEDVRGLPAVSHPPQAFGARGACGCLLLPARLCGPASLRVSRRPATRERVPDAAQPRPTSRLRLELVHRRGHRGVACAPPHEKPSGGSLSLALCAALASDVANSPAAGPPQGGLQARRRSALRRGLV